MSQTHLSLITLVAIISTGCDQTLGQAMRGERVLIAVPVQPNRFNKDIKSVFDRIGWEHYRPSAEKNGWPLDQKGAPKSQQQPWSLVFDYYCPRSGAGQPDHYYEEKEHYKPRHHSYRDHEEYGEW